MIRILLGSPDVLQLNVVRIKVLYYTDVVILLAVRGNTRDTWWNLRSVVTSRIGFLVHDVCEGGVLSWV